MKALILAGGVGTRLRPLSLNSTKPMVPIGNRPLLEHTILHLKKHNITEIVFLLYYRPQTVKDHFRDGAEFGIQARYIIAEADYATAGAVKLASDLVDETFLVVSGDIITKLDISEFIQFHYAKKALASVGLNSVENPSPFGIAVTDDQFKIRQFLEKPSPDQVFSHRVNMGIYLFEPEIFDWIPEKRVCFFAKDIFPELVRKQTEIYGFLDNSYWLDVGNFAAYQKAHRDFFENKLNLSLKEKLKRGVWQGENCRIGRDVKIAGKVVLGDNCRIGEQVTLNNSILGNDCRVENNSSLINSVVWNGVEIAGNCQLKQNVVNSGLKITCERRLRENSFVFD